MPDIKPIIVVGAGPVGLTTALGLNFYGLPFLLFEDDAELSRDTKAGTILTRTIEAFRRYGVADQVLAKALACRRDRRRRARDQHRAAVRANRAARRRYPLSLRHQHAAASPRADSAGGHRCVHAGRAQSATPHDVVPAATPPAWLRRSRRPMAPATSKAPISWPATAAAARSGRSSVCRSKANRSDVRCLLVDVKVDLDVANPRDYPYLAYFADPQEWMILVRQPHCWRFLFPLGPGVPEPTASDFRDKVIRFIGDGRPAGNSQHHRLPHSPPDRDAMAQGSRVPHGRRGASDHPDVGARPQYRHSRRDQPALAAGLGGARVGRRRAARWLCTRATPGRRRRLRRNGGSRAQIYGRAGRGGEGDVRHRAGPMLRPGPCWACGSTSTTAATGPW